MLQAGRASNADGIGFGEADNMSGVFDSRPLVSISFARRCRPEAYLRHAAWVQPAPKNLRADTEPWDSFANPKLRLKVTPVQSWH